MRVNMLTFATPLTKNERFLPEFSRGSSRSSGSGPWSMVRNPALCSAARGRGKRHYLRSRFHSRYIWCDDGSVHRLHVKHVCNPWSAIALLHPGRGARKLLAHQIWSSSRARICCGEIRTLTCIAYAEPILTSDVFLCARSRFS